MANDVAVARKKAHAALLALTPKQYTAVTEYLDRGGTAFGNKTKAMKLAGYGSGTRCTDVFGTPRVEEALDAIREQAITVSVNVIEEIKALSPEAKDELMRQLTLGEGLEPIDPTDVFGPELEQVQGRDDEARLKAINAHNRNLAQIAKERREAARDILAYAEGTPEQRIRVNRESSASELERKLSELSQEDFERLGRALFVGRKNGPDHEDIPVIEAEIIDEE
jgi:phage terminase small subunit